MKFSIPNMRIPMLVELLFGDTKLLHTQDTFFSNSKIISFTFIKLFVYKLVYKVFKSSNYDNKIPPFETLKLFLHVVPVKGPFNHKLINERS